jgi:hypothetical protein
MDCKAMKNLKLIILLIIIIIITGIPVLGQTAHEDTAASKINWKKSLRLRLQLNQLYFENWTKGGENTFNWLLNVDNTFTRTGEKNQMGYYFKIKIRTVKSGRGYYKSYG